MEYNSMDKAIVVSSSVFSFLFLPNRTSTTVSTSKALPIAELEGHPYLL